MWADHADVISKAYSGTGALKTDFTRTGKRSKEGALQDGVNSITRYVKNNYFDGARQDAYDLFTGAWEPSKGLPHPDQRALLVRAMPWVFLFALVMLFASAVLPRHTAAQTIASVAGDDAGAAVKQSSLSSHLYFFTLWLVVAVGSLQFMVSRGLDYVAWPTLNRPDEMIFYDGPGSSPVLRAGRGGEPAEGPEAERRAEERWEARRGLYDSFQDLMTGMGRIDQIFSFVKRLLEMKH